LNPNGFIRCPQRQQHCPISTRDRSALGTYWAKACTNQLQEQTPVNARLRWADRGCSSEGTQLQ
jgi:hypothetical protein